MRGRGRRPFVFDAGFSLVYICTYVQCASRCVRVRVRVLSFGLGPF